MGGGGHQVATSSPLTPLTPGAGPSLGSSVPPPCDLGRAEVLRSLSLCSGFSCDVWLEHRLCHTAVCRQLLSWSLGRLWLGFFVCTYGILSAPMAFLGPPAPSLGHVRSKKTQGHHHPQHRAILQVPRSQPASLLPSAFHSLLCV